jgi:2-polyprenyl-6-methoxyphenol hydroxylase-like FAD-dependent oxidoreductase
MSKEKIAIVGASVAGSATAIILDRAGLDITVFEQQPAGVLVDRGTGIALPKDLVNQLIELDIFDKDFPIINIEDRQFIVHDDQQDDEKLLTIKPFIAYGAHWASVYNNLMKRLPKEKVQYDTKVIEVKQGKKITLVLSDNTEQEFDYVFFADGYNSIGRQYLFPNSQPEFTNYIAWRGILNRVDPETSQHLKDSVPFYLYEKGHMLIYEIPRVVTDHPQDDYIVNWLIYECIGKDHPLRRDNKAHLNIPPIAMEEEYIKYVKDLAQKYFPPFARDIILQTEKPFTQAIYDAWVPHYVVGKMALIGDSSILLRPHVGAGSTKALQDILSLQRYLERENYNLGQVLDDWGKERQQKGEELYTLCRDLGDLLVSNVPNLKQLNKKSLDQHWSNITAGHEDWYQIKKAA